MVGSTTCAVLFLVVAVILTLHPQVIQLHCSAVWDVEREGLNSSEFHGEEESIKLTTQSWRSLQSLSQRRILERLLRDKRRGEYASVERVNSLEYSFAKEAEAADHDARRMNLHEVDKEMQIPVQQVNDKVEELPGQPTVEFAQYAGYVTVNETAGRALFYYFVEATSTPESKPLVLWLNGGPGCSSLGYGAFEELGPFRVHSDGATLKRNDYAWNSVANIIFLESPAGVGFSYSNTSSDYTTNGDTRAASDSLTFLLNWIRRFPKYKYRDFYITGESYAGYYVPQLAQKVVHYNKRLAKPFINIKGFMVGNAVIDALTDYQGSIDYFWTHALISDESYTQLTPCVKNYGPDCDNATTAAFAEIGNINVYDIYTPTCLTNFTTSSNSTKSQGYDPCVDNYVTAYFNVPDVQNALHANVTEVAYPWTLCSDTVTNSYMDSANTVIPIYKELIAAGLKIWVYSGDVDSVVPVTSTRYSLKLLNLTTTVPWYAWYRSKQVGGYTQGYDGLTFVTVRNSGHQTPLYQPARSLSLFTSYITGPKETDWKLCKAEALRQDGWPEIVKESVSNTPVQSVSRSGLADRWNIPGVTPALIKEGVTVAGDVMHPSLGQGGGTAIEDGIVLARTLGAASFQDGDDESIQNAFEEYAAQRQERTFPITVKAFILGAVSQGDFPPMIYLRNKWAIPKLVGPSSFLSHTLFAVTKLPASTVNVK